MGEEVEHGLLRPLALIHVIAILGEAREVDDAEIRAARRETVRRRLSEVIEARPDILSAHVRAMLHYIPRLFVGRAPRGVHVIVSRAHIGRVGIGQPPLLGRHEDRIGGHHVIATRLQGRYTLGEDKGFAWEILWHILYPLMMVIKAYHIDGTTLKEVVIWRGLVAACEDGTRGIVTLHNLCEMLRKERLYGEFSILSERRGIVTSIQNKVGLFEGKRISLGT